MALTALGVAAGVAICGKKNVIANKTPAPVEATFENILAAVLCGLRVRPGEAGTTQ
jgi:hypothetical protein